MNKELLINPEIDNKPRIDFIWTLDRICAWNCPFCCVDALYVRRKGQNIFIQSNGHNLSFPFQENEGDIYTQAAKRELMEEGCVESGELKFTGYLVSDLFPDRPTYIGIFRTVITALHPFKADFETVGRKLMSQVICKENYYGNPKLIETLIDVALSA